MTVYVLDISKNYQDHRIVGIYTRLTDAFAQVRTDQGWYEVYRSGSKYYQVEDPRRPWCNYYVTPWQTDQPKVEAS